MSELVGHAHLAFDRGECTLATFLDISKAFDSLNHNILLEKLCYYGIRGLPLEWFKSYLSGREQIVSYKNTNSDPALVTTGVPQGSVLGPLLFIIYANDLYASIKHCKIISFADDTTVFLSGVDQLQLINKMEIDLGILADWYIANRLCLNSNKTKSLMFRNKSIPLQCNLTSLKVHGSDISLVDETKFLGIIVDKHLDWGKHLDSLRKTLSSVLYILRTCKNILKKNILKAVYFSLFQYKLNHD